MALLQVHEMVKHFGGIKAVDGCSFSVEEGTITALIGPNGAGKTTVFNLICGLEPVDSGQVSFGETPIHQLQPHQITRKGIARTFQISRGLMDLTVLENLIVHSPTKGLMDLFKNTMLSHEKDRAMELLEFMGIAHLAGSKAGGLSFGQKKLMEIASALMAEPRFILLDEPAGGINPALLEQIIERIIQLNQQGITFLIVEHNMDMVMTLCDPVIVMAYGKLLAQGTPAEVQNNQQVLDSYLGES